MTQLTLTPAAKAAIARGIALGKASKHAARELALLVLADPAAPAQQKQWAKLVLEPVLPEQEQREAA